MKNIILVFMVFISVVSFAAVKKEIGIIKSVQGKVIIKNDILKKEEPAKKGRKLYPTDVIRTGKNATVKLGLYEGLVLLSLYENTTVALNQYYQRDKKMMYSSGLLLGKITARVKKAFRQKGHFSVNASTCTAGIRGTTFDVYCPQPKKAWIGVHEGEVAVTGKNVNVLLTPKRQLFFEEHQKPVIKKFVSSAEADKWFQISFEKQDDYVLKSMLTVIIGRLTKGRLGYDAFNKIAVKKQKSLLEKQLLPQKARMIIRLENQLQSYYYALKHLSGEKSAVMVKKALTDADKKIAALQGRRNLFYRNLEKIF